MAPSNNTTSSPTTTSSSTHASSTTNSIDVFKSTNGKLSIGAKAGIALGALVFTAIILVGILFLMRRAKRARMASQSTANVDDNIYDSDKVQSISIPNGKTYTPGRGEEIIRPSG